MPLMTPQTEKTSDMSIIVCIALDIGQLMLSKYSNSNLMLTVPTQRTSIAQDSKKQEQDKWSQETTAGAVIRKYEPKLYQLAVPHIIAFRVT